ncbi:hypothetical protein [Alkalicoccus daliensis]|uniref:Uncharacterized protein n=1 Tax=Alkalicoccus daliensis TaxID=745820 RepID=A0A1H0GVD5_9BACI|nr:hypothetical protein [Alkalicoccus daliensis]SDO10847.1 hypothetical protein SAMN04488053_10751 [Alkalicoccus daliensis]
MWILISFWVIALAAVIATIKYRKPLLLTVPFFAMLGFLVVQIAMVPMPFWETVRFVFSLR